LEKRNAGVVSEGREVSIDGEKPASLAAAMTANGGVAAEKEKVLISMVPNLGKILIPNLHAT
jgi:hypothetical protein